MTRRFLVVPFLIAACGNPTVVRSPLQDRIAAEELCTENGDAFDGLAVLMVPGSAQTLGLSETSTIAEAGCIRLFFEEDGEPESPDLDIALPSDLNLVSGRRELVADCSFAQALVADPSTDQMLVAAVGTGDFDGSDNLSTLNLEATLEFEDPTAEDLIVFSLSARELQVRNNRCRNDF
ncbi:MAG: hypothetical protein ACFB9M_18710 [Myxococcota bacterium]